MNTIFKSGLCSTFSNSSIMNKNKQVSHSKQETISVIFTHPSPNLLLSKIQHDKFDLTGNSKDYIGRSMGHKTLLITSSTFLNSGR